MFQLLTKIMGGNQSNACRNLSVAQTKEVIDSLKQGKSEHLILDVRGPDEFREGYIAGAKNLPVSELGARIQEISEHKSNPVIVYCRSGGRSSVAAQILAANGFANVTNVSGGMLDWQSNGYPVKRG